VAALVAESAAGPRPAAPAAAHAAGEADPGQADPGAADAGELTYARVFGCIGAVLDETWLAVPDTLLGIASAANLPVAGRDAFLCSAVWASIGHSVAAAVGASFGSGRRPLVVCGDGGFRMTAQALSTMARYGRDPVVVVVENGIYAYEQYLVGRGYFADPHAEPEPYVALDRWDLVAVARGLGVQCARSASTVAEFQQALADAQASPGPALVVARVDPHGLPAELA
jgi:indolepyruvate decarboxylase